MKPAMRFNYLCLSLAEYPPKKHWGCIPVMAGRSIDMDHEPLLSSQHPGGSVEESIKAFFNNVPMTSLNLNTRITHSGLEEIASSIFNEGYPLEGCCAGGRGEGGLKTIISMGQNELSSLSLNRSIDLLGKFPYQNGVAPSKQLGYKESELIVDNLMTSEATSITREW
ncbi:unnamed protein product [Sphagnum jensenii]|uniref:Uncharacterized protein n=1 Tax=Sphagnum jensenii TaxID=128206 RepID=A0ABP1BJI7_9BRYO